MRVLPYTISTPIKKEQLKNYLVALMTHSLYNEMSPISHIINGLIGDM